MKVSELIENGSVITYFFEGGGTVDSILAGVLWSEPRMIRWVGTFPEHQGHIHHFRYSTVNQEAGGRDVAFYDEKSRLVAYISPIEEGSMDVRQALDEWRRWQKILAYGNNQETFLEFFENA